MRLEIAPRRIQGRGVPGADRAVAQRLRLIVHDGVPLLREGGAVSKEVVLVLDAHPYEHQTLLLLLGRRGGTARVAALQHAVGLPVVP